MNKKDLVFGFLIGLATTLVGSYVFITFFTDFKFIAGIQIMKSQGNLGKIITLGSVLTLIAFGILLKINREIMARGVVLAIIALTILTLFI
ncbi:hypothetical protein SAMN05444395_101103 [Flavobacterium fryxellicola]|uniref:Uncharacterized protein n=1 Tax=Flavobacterium fryxellicola TaxID=249352 RepID=A0A167U155_9FLAO|nr:hypothetical protein [Flavobacterium fryxellicola]OAB25152.1 hypothetical protein FBFR_15845 [Flavobacterium fryxellicola]SHN49931.1 hypothetical protein SAMN05444395_101103 [Flavobacterium fryxellicola]